MADSDQPRLKQPSTRHGVPRTPDALDVALERSDDDTARALLAKHTELLDRQIASERLDHSLKRMQVATRLLLAGAAFIIMAGFVWMVLAARADRGLVIEAFAVPPDLAARGLTGEVLAGNLADRLGDIDRSANSFRSPETMSVNWGDDVKIEIPSTGVSVGELDRFLRREFGHQTVIGGSVFRTPQGLRMTVRSGALGTVEQTGSDPQLEDMVRKAAEGVFQRTQPYRYSKYLEFSGRTEEAMAVAQQLAANSDDPRERAWAWAQISNLLETVDMRQAAAAGYRAIQEDPGNALAYLNTCIALDHLSHPWDSDPICQKAAQLGSRPEGGLSIIGVNTSRANLAAAASQQGDFASALRQLQLTSGQKYAGVEELDRAQVSSLLAATHDVSGSRRVAGNPSDIYLATHFANSGGLATPQADRAVALRDWQEAITLLQASLAVVDRHPEGAEVARLERERAILPRLATVLAHSGQIQQARAIVAGLPDDCFNCIVAKGMVAGLGGDFSNAQRSVAEADSMRPNAPFADTALAQILLDAGRYREALDVAKLATNKGPKYPDALKVRGDALRKLNHLDEAVDSYAKAAEGAPRWGRLQIDWGFAEMRRGRWNDARQHLAAAATMDLNPLDQALLAKLRRVAGAR